MFNLSQKFKLPTLLAAILLAALLLTATVTLAQSDTESTLTETSFSTNTPSATPETASTPTLEAVLLVTAEETPPVVPVEESGGGETISAALVNSLFERLQGASQTQIIFTLIVFAVVVIPLAGMLYKSTPPGAVKDRLGDEIKTAVQAGLKGLDKVVKLTPPDIDDRLIEWMYQQLQEKLKPDIASAVDAKFDTIG